MNQRRLVWRELKNNTFSIFCYLSAIGGLIVLAHILFTLFWYGLPGINLALFTENTPPPKSESSGGLANAIMGSLIMTGLGALIASFIGIMTATFLSEYAVYYKKLTSLFRFMNDTLLSTPSIIIGLFVYSIMVKPMKTYSAFAGSVALAIIALPIITRTVQDVLLLVPNTMRESAAALGASKPKIIVKICWRAARFSIVTGILLAVARMSGETAPLLFTALNNLFANKNLMEPMANLPVTIFQFAMSPYEQWQQLAWSGALLITLSILLLNIFVRFIFKK